MLVHQRVDSWLFNGDIYSTMDFFVGKPWIPSGKLTVDIDGYQWIVI